MHMGPVIKIKQVTAEAHKGYIMIAESNMKKGKLE